MNALGIVICLAFLPQHVNQFPITTTNGIGIAEQAWGSDCIGTYQLLLDGKRRGVKLYVYDSDWMARRRFCGWIYPNLFGIQAVYQDVTGKWAFKELDSRARVSFVRVLKHDNQAIILELRPNFMIDLGSLTPEDIERAAKINTPFTKRLCFVDGVPTLK